MNTAGKLSFLSHDKRFYKILFSLLGFVALQNVIGYTVNMADNLMLGVYGQTALSGAAAVNQIFFLLQQFAISVGNTLVTLAGQYWGEKRPQPIRILTGYALKLAGIVAICLVIAGMAFPGPLCSIFTSDAAIIEQGVQYMRIVIWSFGLYCLSNTLYAALRAIGIVRISFYLSIVSLVINCGINYVLIFGKFGFPEMGVAGAAIGTLVSRIVEFVIILIYCGKNQTLAIFQKGLFQPGKNLRKDFYKIYRPIFLSTVVWAISIPVQTAILGHLSSDALAANNVATTFYQYAKVICVALSSVSGVMISNAIGKGERELVKQAGRTLSVIDVIVSIILAALLFFLRTPLLSLYNLMPEALQLADSLIILQAVIMLGMGYQMPVSFGIIQQAGDAKFTMKMNLICTWLIVMPFTFMAAYWWKLPIVWLVLVIQSDQLFKCLPVWIKFRKYTWIRKLTRD